MLEPPLSGWHDWNEVNKYGGSCPWGQSLLRYQPVRLWYHYSARTRFVLRKSCLPQSAYPSGQGALTKVTIDPNVGVTKPELDSEEIGAVVLGFFFVNKEQQTSKLHSGCRKVKSEASRSRTGLWQHASVSVGSWPSFKSSSLVSSERNGDCPDFGLSCTPSGTACKWHKNWSSGKNPENGKIWGGGRADCLHCESVQEACFDKFPRIIAPSDKRTERITVTDSIVVSNNFENSWHQKVS